MWLEKVSNPEHLALESDALPTALRVPALIKEKTAASGMSGVNMLYAYATTLSLDAIALILLNSYHKKHANLFFFFG